MRSTIKPAGAGGNLQTFNVPTFKRNRNAQNIQTHTNQEHDVKNFALTGAAGYVAPRHLKAIRDTGNQLVAAVDPHDSVGILDSYFPNAAFFTEFERFDRHLEKLRRSNKDGRAEYVSV